MSLLRADPEIYDTNGRVTISKHRVPAGFGGFGDDSHGSVASKHQSHMAVGVGLGPTLLCALAFLSEWRIACRGLRPDRMKLITTARCLEIRDPTG